METVRKLSKLFANHWNRTTFFLHSNQI